MTKRTLPAISFPRARNDVTFEIPKRAMDGWDRGVTALAGDDTVTIFDAIGDFYDGGFTVARMAAALRAIGDRPVTVQINSPGGIYDDGLAIYNLLRAHPAPVTTQVVGMAASAASIIALAGDEIQIGKAAHLMIHNVQWIAMGDRHVMAEVLGVMAIMDRTLAALYVDRTGLEPDAVSAMMDAETYMSGETAVELGFADAFLPADPARRAAAPDKPLAFRIEAALQKGGWSRAEARRAIKEIRGTPGAAADGTPGAAEPEAAGGLDSLRLAAARLSLLRA